jgi:hypothetical protein
LSGFIQFEFGGLPLLLQTEVGRLLRFGYGGLNGLLNPLRSLNIIFFPQCFGLLGFSPQQFLFNLMPDRIGDFKGLFYNKGKQSLNSSLYSLA